MLWAINTQEVKRKARKEQVPIPKFKDGIYYYAWVQNMEDTLDQVEGVREVPMQYACRRPKLILWTPEEDAKNKTERIVYQASQLSPEFKENNKQLYSMIEESCTDTLSYDIIKKFKKE